VVVPDAPIVVAHRLFGIAKSGPPGGPDTAAEVKIARLLLPDLLPRSYLRRFA
jgi:hypothetical protein